MILLNIARLTLATCGPVVDDGFLPLIRYEPCPPLHIPAPTPPAPLIKKEPPPIQKSTRGPIVTESRSTSVASEKTAKAPALRCQVGFWNVTGRDVQLSVEGKSQTLAKNRSITMEVDRHFLWQIEEGERNAERVPDHLNQYEVIIR